MLKEDPSGQIPIHPFPTVALDLQNSDGAVNTPGPFPIPPKQIFRQWRSCTVYSGKYNPLIKYNKKLWR